MSARRAAPPPDHVIEGEAVEVTPEKPPSALVVAPQAHVVSGLGAVANLSDEEFERNLAIIAKGVERASRMQVALLVVDVDYGSLPGIKRPFLHQPGAEKFEKAYGLASSFVVERHVGDGEQSPDLEFIATCRVHLGDTAGPVIAEGTGEASSWETKYRYRTIFEKRSCPDCGQPTVIKLREKPPEREGQSGRPEAWWCATREGGCGHSFPKGSEKFGAIDAQKTGSEKIENPDPWDLANTLVKMACKRAHVAGILRATATSGLFTQDEDSPTVKTPAGTNGAGAAQAPASPPESAQGAAQPPQASTGATAAPGPSEAVPDGPAGLQGVVTERPDGIRQVRLTRPNKTGGPFEKFEVRFKVAGRQHTAMLLDDLARGAEALELQVGEVVRVIGGQVEEVEWQQGKPKKKELWDATGLVVLRDNEWWAATQAAPTLGFGEAGPQPPSSLAPNTSGSLTSSPDASSTSAPPTASTPSTPSASSSAAIVPVRKTGPTGEVITLKVRILEPVQFVKRGEREAGILKAVDPDTGEIVHALLGDDPPGEVEAQLGSSEKPYISEGDIVTIVGTWHNDWVIVTAIGKAG